MSDETWKILLREALACIDTLPRSLEPVWSFGGGTVLMLHYEHRMSKDIDIFIRDAQYLTFLSPRLNDRVAALSEDYDEQSTFLKLRISPGEIDFIVAPTLTSPGWEKWCFEGRVLRKETPAEVGAKKVFYRASELKVRDVLDLAFVLEHNLPEVMANKEVFFAKADILRSRLILLEKNFEKLALEQIALLPRGMTMLPSAWARVWSFFAGGKTRKG